MQKIRSTPGNISCLHLRSADCINSWADTWEFALCHNWKLLQQRRFINKWIRNTKSFFQCLKTRQGMHNNINCAIHTWVHHMGFVLGSLWVRGWTVSISIASDIWVPKCTSTGQIMQCICENSCRECWDTITVSVQFSWVLSYLYSAKSQQPLPRDDFL